MYILLPKILNIEDTHDPLHSISSNYSVYWFIYTTKIYVRQRDFVYAGFNYHYLL
jgi:hypothetical protein